MSIKLNPNLAPSLSAEDGLEITGSATTTPKVGVDNDHKLPTTTEWNAKADGVINNGVLTIQKNGSTIQTFSANQSGNVTVDLDIPTDTNDLTNGAGFITAAAIKDGTLTIQQNGTNVATFSANQSGNATANISVPTNTNQLENGAGFITAASLPTVNNGTLTIQKNGTTETTFSANQSADATVNLAAVAFSGNYGDLTNQPNCVEVQSDAPNRYAKIVNDGGDINIELSRVDSFARSIKTNIKLTSAEEGVAEWGEIWDNTEGQETQLMDIGNFVYYFGMAGTRVSGGTGTGSCHSGTISKSGLYFVKFSVSGFGGLYTGLVEAGSSNSGWTNVIINTNASGAPIAWVVLSYNSSQNYINASVEPDNTKTITISSCIYLGKI